MNVHIKSDATLLKRLQEAAERGVSVRERHEQRVSFIASGIKEGSTAREKIEAFVAKRSG